jgi:hypothetical protein
MRQAVRGLTDFVVIAPTRDSTCQIKHMEFDPWMTQQMGEVPDSPGVLQTKNFPAVAYSPILARFAKHPLLGGRPDARYRLAVSS